jgi:hypothetical protein
VIILWTHKGHVVSGECTECGPSNAGILSIPAELDLPLDEGASEDEFTRALIESLARPIRPWVVVKEGEGR